MKKVDFWETLGSENNLALDEKYLKVERSLRSLPSSKLIALDYITSEYTKSLYASGYAYLLESLFYDEYSSDVVDVSLSNLFLSGEIKYRQALSNIDNFSDFELLGFEGNTFVLPQIGENLSEEIFGYQKTIKEIERFYGSLELFETYQNDFCDFCDRYEIQASLNPYDEKLALIYPETFKRIEVNQKGIE